MQIFTNADQAHATQVLSRLGLEDCFQGVICFETLYPSAQEGKEAIQIENQEFSFKPQIQCKPSLQGMEAASRIANVDPCKNS